MLQIIQRIKRRTATAIVVFQGMTQKEVEPESVIPPSSLAKLRSALYQPYPQGEKFHFVIVIPDPARDT